MKMFVRCLIPVVAVLVSLPVFAADVQSQVGVLWQDANGTFLFKKADGTNWCTGTYANRDWVRISVGRSGVTDWEQVRLLVNLVTAAKLSGKTVTVVNVRENGNGFCDYDYILMN